MRIRTFTAARMDEALGIIRTQLGPEALILGTRKVKQANGEMGLEITAALPEPAGASVEAVSNPVGDVRSTPLPTTPPWQAHGLAADLITRLTSAVGGLAGAGFTGTDALEMVLGKLIAFKNPAEMFSAGKVHLLLGPTGSGKTTLACKLALQAKAAGRRVGLMSLDDQKIGGFEPLALTAETLGDSAYLLQTAADLSEANASLGPRHFVLIDTPGLSAYDTVGIAALHARVQALNLPYVAHIVVPASLAGASASALPVVFHRFSPASIIFSKLDEAGHFGMATTLAVNSALAVGVATHAAKLTTPPLTLTPRYLAETLNAVPYQPWEKPL